jgi:protein gp37
MAGKTNIEWATDTWNPVTGCTKVSPGCDHCYAIPMSRRVEAMQAGQPFRTKPNDYAGTTIQRYDAAGRVEPVDWTGKVNLLHDRLDQPIRWSKPRRIFVNSMSDLFHEQVPDAFIAEVFAVMHRAEQHTFQVLTKRHARMRSLLSSDAFHGMVVGAASEYTRGADPGVPWPLPNVWVGVSVENQQWANIRVPALLETPAAVRWLSMEPLLGAVTFRWAPWTPVVDSDHLDGLRGLDWIVVGGESGPGARPLHPEWARTIRDACHEAGVPFLFKQWGAYEPAGYGAGRNTRDDEVWLTPGNPNDPRFTHTVMRRVGKHDAGRVLDGRTWDEYPKETP